MRTDNVRTADAAPVTATPTSIVLANLSNVEAAIEIVEQVTERLARAAEELVASFLTETGWDGEFDDLSRFWVAPPDWRGLAALGGIQYARFALAPTPAGGDGDDRFLLASLTGTGRQRAALEYRREPAGSPHAFAKLLAKHRDIGEQLAGLGFERGEHHGHRFSLPVVLGAAAIARGVDHDALDQALAPLAAALQIARRAAPVMKPLIDWTIEQLER